MTNLKLHSCYALASAVVLGVAACSNGGGDTTRFAAPTGPSADLLLVPQTAVVCKVGPVGTYDFSASATGNDNTGDLLLGASFSLTVTDAAVPACVTVFTRTNSELDAGGADAPAAVVVTELAHAGTSLQSVVDSGGAVAGTTVGAVATVYVNGFHSAKVTYTNVADAPPPVCDFITFGRLVTTINGQKVVISGNAGGNAPGGGFLNEFHIEANGVDNHVANIDTYGPITSGPLSGLTNSRIATGTAKNGVAVELRVWDGGEPGKDTDIVYVKLNGVELLGANGQLIDQGNMQYHSNCRGPK
jgi:hypothetical protein